MTPKKYAPHFERLNFITPKEGVTWLDGGDFEGSAIVGNNLGLTAMFHPNDGYYEEEIFVFWEYILKSAPKYLMIKELESTGYKVI